MAKIKAPLQARFIENNDLSTPWKQYFQRLGIFDAINLSDSNPVSSGIILSDVTPASSNSSSLSASGASKLLEENIDVQANGWSGESPEASRSDHIHPTDLTRASQTEVDAISDKLDTLWIHARYKFAGVVSAPVITKNINLLSIGPAIYQFYNYDKVEQFVVQSSATFDLANYEGDTVYAYANYNSGNPIISITTDSAFLFDNKQQSLLLIGIYEYTGAGILGQDCEAYGVGLPERILAKNLDTLGPVKSKYDTFELTVLNTNLDFSISAGNIWNGLDVVEKPIHNSTSTTTYIAEYDGSSWDYNSITHLNNTQYQGVSGLSVVSDDTFVVNWVYLYSYSDQDIIYILPADSEYDLMRAQASEEPENKPNRISEHCLLIAKVIIRKGETAVTQIDSAFSHKQPIKVIHNEIDERDALACHPSTSITHVNNQVSDTTVDEELGRQASLHEFETTQDYTIYENENALFVDSFGGEYDVSVYGVAHIESFTEPNVYVPTASGMLGVPALTDNGDGSITVGFERCVLYDSITNPTRLKWFNIEEATLSLTNEATNYIYVDYNDGLPIYAVTTNRDLICSTNLMTRTIVATYLRRGTILTGLDWDTSGLALPEKLLNRTFDTSNRFSKSLFDGGLVITDEGSHVFKVTAGKIWAPLKCVEVNEVVSDVGNVSLFYLDGSLDWQETAVTTYNYTQYQNPLGGLSTLSPNKFAVNYLFRDTTSDTIYIILGRGDYKLIEAQAASIPEVPPVVSSYCLYIGRIIVEKDAASSTQIDIANLNTVSYTPVTIHNDISLRDASDCHPAASITNVPYGENTYTDVQGSLDYIEDELERFRISDGDSDLETGFGPRPDSTITVSTRTFTVGPTGTDFYYYHEGVKIVKTGGLTCETTCPATVGIHYIYFDAADNQLKNSMTPWAFRDGQIFVALGYWNGSAMARFDERHRTGRDLNIHEYLHKTRGMAYESGFSQIYPDSSNDFKLSLGSGIAWDEDIQHSIDATTRCRYWYQTTGGAWVWSNGVDNSGFDIPFFWNSGTSRVQYPKSDNNYTLTDLTVGQYVNVYVYASNDMDRPIAIVIPALTTPYATQALAEAEVPPSLTLSPEMKLLYRWTIKGNGDYISSADYRLSSPVPGGGVSASLQHNNTLGIQGGTTGDYYHITSAQHTVLTAYTTVGANLLSITNPSAIRFIRINADNTVSALSDSDFRTAIGAGTSSTVGTVTSVALSVPTGLQVTGSPITSAGTLAVSFSTGYSIPTTASQGNWDTAYSERRQWDGGATNLNAATGRTSLGATTVGGNIFTLTNPSAIRFLRINVDNTVSALSDSDFRTAIGVSGTSDTIAPTAVLARIYLLG